MFTHIDTHVARHLRTQSHTRVRVHTHTHTHTHSCILFCFVSFRLTSVRFGSFRSVVCCFTVFHYFPPLADSRWTSDWDPPTWNGPAEGFVMHELVRVLSTQEKHDLDTARLFPSQDKFFSVADPASSDFEERFRWIKH